MTVSHPRIFLLDGASAAGKTTLALTVAAQRDDTAFVRRQTTRPRRGPDDDRELEFVTRSEFDAAKHRGDFLEYRDFLFGMSYGLSMDAVEAVLSSGRHVLALANLTRIAVAKERDARVVAILVDVPLDVLRDRLLARGTHGPEQIAERLENARSVDQYRRYYDHIVRNDGSVEAAVAAVNDIIDRYNVQPPPAAR